MRGPLFETFVAQNLDAILATHKPDARLHFWNIQGRHEVDFVITHGRAIITIEVKAATTFNDDDLSGLRSLAQNTNGPKKLILAYGGAEQLELGNNIHVVPIATLLS